MFSRTPKRLAKLIVGILGVLSVTSCAGISLGTYDITPDWSPNGETIAFVCYEPTLEDIASGRHDGELPYPSESAEICTMLTDGRARQQLTHNHTAEHDPVWSPDGLRIAYVSHDELYIMNADGSDQRAVSSSTPILHPVWAPDGHSIAFTVGVKGIHILDLDTGHEWQLSEGRLDLPVWSPDGQHIAFVEQIEGSSCAIHIALVAAGSEIIPPVASDCRIPAWSPRGAQLAFVVRDVNRRASVISILDLETLKILELATDERGVGDNLLWLPEGDSILYSAGGDLLVVRVDNSEKRLVSNLNGSVITFFNKRSLALSPDGQQVAFTRLEGKDSFEGPVRIWKIIIGKPDPVQLSP